jgi:hypothetical protein
MHALDQLGLIAQIATTYSGFVAIFIAFVGRDGRFAAADAHFVQAMVFATAYTLVFALAPPVLSQLMADADVWHTSSLLAVLISLPIGAFQVWMQFKMPGEESQKISPWWHVPGWALAGATALVYLTAFLGWGPPAGLYVGANTLSLAIAVWCFIAIVFRKFF